MLELINRARQALGLKALSKIPKGVPWDLYDCPLARALPVKMIWHGYIGSYIIFPSEEYAAKVSEVWGTELDYCAVDLPEPLAKFDQDFDEGEYPELIEKEVTMTKLVNLTPHSVKLHLDSGEIRTVEPSGVICRAFERKFFEGKVELDGDSIPIYEVSFGEPIGLPDPKPDTLYIVSLPAALAIREHCPDRDDIVMVTDLVRDVYGVVIGALALAKLTN